MIGVTPQSCDLEVSRKGTTKQDALRKSYLRSCLGSPSLLSLVNIIPIVPTSCFPCKLYLIVIITLQGTYFSITILLKRRVVFIKLETISIDLVYTQNILIVSVTNISRGQRLAYAAHVTALGLSEIAHKSRFSAPLFLLPSVSIVLSQIRAILI